MNEITASESGERDERNLTTQSLISSRAVRTGLISLTVFTLQACLDSTVQRYGPITLPLDALNELHISTYPADFPDELKSIPFLYKQLRTPDDVYFQLFVREAGTSAGKNPNIQSITIHSFSNYFPGQQPTELVSDYEQSFWMQDQPNDNPEGSEPVPFDEHWYLRVNIDLTLNGVNYRFDEQIDAATTRRFAPLLLYVMQ